MSVLATVTHQRVCHVTEYRNIWVSDGLLVELVSHPLAQQKLLRMMDVSAGRKREKAERSLIDCRMDLDIFVAWGTNTFF